jgi:energy-coupling factor transport system permease protein
MSPRRRGPARRRIAYLPGDSIFHRLHPLVKGAWLLAGTVLVFLVHSPWLILSTVLLLVVGLAITGVSIASIRGLRLFLSTAVLIGFVQIIFAPSGAVLFSLGPVQITSGGLSAGVYVAGRFISVILLSYVFVLTTEPNDLAYALMQSGLPYRYGFAFVTALRLAPAFETEGRVVYKAQLARGVQYDLRSPRRLVTLARQFFLPLLTSALGRVDRLAVSMEGRCFGLHPKRTFLRTVRFHRIDGVALAVLMATITATAIVMLSAGG